MKEEKLISIVIPCFNEEKTIPIFYQEINKISKKMREVNYEYIFIDDGSKDNTLKVIKELKQNDERVRYISFSRNFGKEAGMLAGLEASRGDYVAIMDVDLQDPPAMLLEMYKGITKENYDCVALYTKTHTGYGFIRKKLTNLWYKLISKISNTNTQDGARDFRLMKRKMVDYLISMREYNRYTKGMFEFIGFETKWIAYDAPVRKVGKSKYNNKNLIKYAMDGLIDYSTSILILSAYVGLFFCLISFIAVLVIILKTLIWGDPVAGWPSLACIVTFVGGIQLFFLGIIGFYLSKIYLEVKRRPIYVVKEQSK